MKKRPLKRKPCSSARVRHKTLFYLRDLSAWSTQLDSSCSTTDGAHSEKWLRGIPQNISRTRRSFQFWDQLTMHPEGEVNRGLYHLFLSRQEVAGNWCISFAKGKPSQQTLLMECWKWNITSHWLSRWQNITSVFVFYKTLFHWSKNLVIGKIKILTSCCFW